MHSLITGGAGFIERATVLDNFDPFSDRAVKEANIAAHVDSLAADGIVERWTDAD